MTIILLLNILKYYVAANAVLTIVMYIINTPFGKYHYSVIIKLTIKMLLAAFPLLIMASTNYLVVFLRRRKRLKR